MIWAAYNGYLGNGPVCALVEAGSEFEAKEIALATFAKENNTSSFVRVVEIEKLELPKIVELE